MNEWRRLNMKCRRQEMETHRDLGCWLPLCPQVSSHWFKWSVVGETEAKSPTISSCFHAYLSQGLVSRWAPNSCNAEKAEPVKPCPSVTLRGFSSCLDQCPQSVLCVIMWLAAKMVSDGMVPCLIYTCDSDEGAHWLAVLFNKAFKIVQK